jgi:arylsulfatase A-like enzyme
MASCPNAEAPQNVVVVLLDSLNRHMLGAYGGTEFATPNLDRFAARSSRFTNHVTGSLPCMPARHDILCGALDFLWKPWGSIELWEESITATLRRAGVTTMLVSDHPHLFETGGENYHTDFTAWDYVRGGEGDPWRTHPDLSAIGAPTSMPATADGGWFLRSRFGIGDGTFGRRHYDDTRSWFREEADLPGPNTMRAAADWLRTAPEAHDRWLLFVDEFDPHEPFDTPEPWASMYDDEPWTEARLVWPPYAVGAQDQGFITEAQARHIRANYGAKLSMIDHWFGTVLDELDGQGLWDSTAVIVCTDHGHFLGERRATGAPGDDEVLDVWGKPVVPQFEPLGHTPLMIHWPGVQPKDVSALSTNVDLNATIADVFGVEARHRTHGHSLAPLLTGTATSVRESAIGGVFGNWVQVTDGHRKYARAPVDDNFPLSMWSNRWSTMPIQSAFAEYMRFPLPDRRASLDFMPGSEIPVIRQPFAPGDVLPFWASGESNIGRHHLYDLSVDPDEHENRTGESVEAEMTDLLRTALVEVEAPDDQLARLGL